MQINARVVEASFRQKGLCLFRIEGISLEFRIICSFREGIDAAIRNCTIDSSHQLFAVNRMVYRLPELHIPGNTGILVEEQLAT